MKKIFLIVLSIVISVSAQERNSQQNNSINIMPISVTIGGKFIVNGSFPASMTERVDQFVTRIYNLAKENALSVAKDIQTSETINRTLEQEYAIRGIILKSADGKEKIIDLAKYRITGDFSHNPYLKNDDVIIFPAVDIDRNFINVLGAVNNPIKFTYIDGDKLSDALLFSQGVNKAYDRIEKVLIFRLNFMGDKFDTISVKLNDEFELQRGDRVYVFAGESKRQDYKVNVIGEVKNPGYIPITDKNTTIRDVIKIAGGFTTEADPSRAELIRGANAFESLLFSEQLEKLQMARMSKLIESDTLYFQIDEKLRFIRGNGLIDFTKIFDENLIDGNFAVQDYDVIYVPSKINLVYVYGQVNKAGYINYISGKTFDYYLNIADGLGETAANTYIIKGQSRSWISAEEYPNTLIEPGDFIWVSKQTPRTFWYHVEQAARITAIIGSVATVILLFK